jgi:dTDP-4-amino-4,6-dideoxygalactose transaminase
VVDSGWYVLGPEVLAFERDLARAVGTSHAVGLANGTDALQLALASVGVEAGDEVVTVANAGGYSTAAIHAIGAFPVYVDVADDDLLISPQAVEDALTARTRAVVVTHLYGRLAPVEAVLAVCRPLRVAVVEDCAQAIGAVSRGRAAGSFGDAGTFSFYPTKNLGALGDAGAVVTSREGVSERVRHLRQYGWSAKYRVSLAGGRNSRLDELQAAVLRVRLPHLEAANERRRAILTAYVKAAASAGIQLVGGLADDATVAHLAVLRCAQRQASADALRELGIATDVHYPVPDHWQSTHGGAAPSLPVTERACGEVLTVPCFPELTDLEVERVCVAIETRVR